MHLNRSAWIALCFLTPAFAGAADPTPAPTPMITVGGRLDVYYSYVSTRPAPSLATPDGHLAPAQLRFRNFDVYHNQFGLNLAEINFRRTGGEAGFRIDLDVGQMADLTHPTATSTDEVSKHVGQAYVQYSPAAVPGLVITAGKMATHVGYETTKAQDNWQYSRSFLYALALPYWHTGASVSYPIIEGLLTPTLYVYNGWNSIFDNNSGKTAGLQLSFTLGPGFLVNYNLLAGPEQADNNGDYRVVNDVNLSWSFSPSFSIAADFAYGTEANAPLPGRLPANASWLAGTLAAKYFVTERYWISPRVEFYRDPEGYTTGTGVAQTLSGITFTNGYQLTDGLETRLELRRDGSTEEAFPTKDGHTSSQYNATLALLFSF